MEVLSILDHYKNTKIDSHFRVVIIAVQRAKQLLQGDPPTTQRPFAKDTCRAIYEVLEDDVEFVTGTEARLFKEANEHAQERAAELQAQVVGPVPGTPEATGKPAKAT